MNTSKSSPESPAKEQPGEQNERRQGHKALRVRDGELETFDPHPPATASAAPDVAAMVRLLNDLAGEFVSERPTLSRKLREATALIEKLGQGWIPVSERLPEEKVDVVLAWFQVEHQPTAQTGYYQGGRWYALDCGTYDRLARLVDPTHWMPLPPPPERP